MSRQSKIVEALQKLKEMKIVTEFSKEVDPARKDGGLHWFVMLSYVEVNYYTTDQVEAFITGADAMSRAKIDFKSEVA